MLNFLLSSPPFPPETFGNLLLLYVKFGCHDLAADVMAENAALTYELLDAGAYDFLDATIMAQTSHEAAFAKFEALGGAQLDALRRLQRSAADARAARDAAALKAAVQAHRECLEALVPVLMGQAKLLWDRALYASAERLLRGAGECAGESDTWQLNLAHAVFMQEGRFADAASLYEPVVRKHWDSILDVTGACCACLLVLALTLNVSDGSV
jgi:tetratricopeptide repeat protein 30